MEKRVLVNLVSVVLVFLSHFSLSAQIGGLMISSREPTGNIIGYVHTNESSEDGETIQLLNDVTITIISSKQDTLEYQSKKGDFSIKNIRTGQANLIVKKEGFHTFSETINVKLGDQLVTVELIPIGELLESAVISDAMPLYTMRGDTLVYNASAVKTLPGDYAIDILKQMPGAEISQYGIKVGGKDIVRTYVNNILVFGKNPVTALNNLAAGQVVTMEVYDENSVVSSIDRHEFDRVMNIKTKEPIFDVTDIQLLLSGGSDYKPVLKDGSHSRYAAGLSGNFYSELLQIQADLLTNNLGVSSILSGNIFSLPYGRVTDRQDNQSASLVLNKYWGHNIMSRSELSLSYRFGNTHLKAIQNSVTDYYNQNNILNRAETDSSINRSSSYNHTIGLQATKTFGALVRVNGNSSVVLVDRNVDLSKYRESSEANSEKLSENSKTVTSSDVSSYKGSLLISGLRVPIVLQSSVAVNKDRTGESIVDTLETSTHQRFLQMSGDDYNKDVSMSVSSRFNINKRLRVTPEYAYRYKEEQLVRIAYDSWQLQEPVVNNTNTFDYSYKYNVHTGGLHFQHRLNLFGLVLEYVNMSPSHSWVSLMPSFDISTWNNQLIFKLSSSQQVPSLEQVRNRIDDRNPLQVSVGNATLRPSTTYTLNTRYAKRKQGELISPTFLDINLVLLTKPIIRDEYYYSSPTILEQYDDYWMPAGSSLLTYKNDNFSFSGKIGLTHNHLVQIIDGKYKFNLSFVAAAEYSQAPYRFNNVTTKTESYVFPLDFAVNSTITERFRINLSSSHRYNNTVNNAKGDKRQLYNADTRFTTTIIPITNTQIECEYRNNYRFLFGEQKSWNQDYLKISVGLSMLNNSLKILFEGIDLMKSGQEYQVSMNQYAVVKSFKPVYGKYFMLSLKYRFNSTQSKIRNSR